MKQYLLYAFTGILNLAVILIYFGLSAGFANYIPVIAIVGCLLLFLLATPFSLFKKKVGALMALICCVLIFPFNVGYLYYTFTDKNVSYDAIVFLFQVPSLLNFIVIWQTLKMIFGKDINWQTGSNNSGRSIKVALALLPFLLFGLYAYSISGNIKLISRNDKPSIDIRGTWGLVADPMPVNYPQLYFNDDSSAVFTSRGDTIFRFKYYIFKSTDLVLEDINGAISSDKILKMDQDSLIFETLRDNNTIQRYIKKYK